MLGTVNILMARGSLLHMRAKFPYDIFEGAPSVSLGSPAKWCQWGNSTLVSNDGTKSGIHTNLHRQSGWTHRTPRMSTQLFHQFALQSGYFERKEPWSVAIQFCVSLRHHRDQKAWMQLHRCELLVNSPRQHHERSISKQVTCNLLIHRCALWKNGQSRHELLEIDGLPIKSRIQKQSQHATVTVRGSITLFFL